MCQYDVFFRTLSDRFDPASHVSLCRSKFNSRHRRHLEESDTHIDAINLLFRDS